MTECDGGVDNKQHTTGQDRIQQDFSPNVSLRYPIYGCIHRSIGYIQRIHKDITVEPRDPVSSVIHGKTSEVLGSTTGCYSVLAGGIFGENRTKDESYLCI